MRVELFYQKNEVNMMKSVDEIKEISLEKHENLPFTSCEVIMATTDFFRPCYEVKVYYKEEMIFHGVVDNQDIETGREGCFLKINSRSKIGALIFDNRVKPAAYENITITELVTNHLSQYGILGVDCDDVRRIPYFSVGLNDSPWDIVKSFCQEIYSITPYISKDKIVVKKPSNTKTIIVSNKEEEGFFSFSEINYSHRREKLISQVILLDENNNETLFLNKDAKDVKRVRYLEKSSKWSVFPRWDARKVIKNSNESGFEVEIALPYILGLSLGDYVKFEKDSDEIFRIVFLKKHIGRKITTKIKAVLEAK